MTNIYAILTKLALVMGFFHHPARVEKAEGISISLEKLLLLGVIIFIWAGVFVTGRFMPNQSTAILLLVLITMYGLLISLANFHQRRKLAHGTPLCPESNSYHPSVNIVVAAHNEAAVIRDTVKNLLAIDYDNYELLVIDDRSSDGTADILAELAESLRTAPSPLEGEGAAVGEAKPSHTDAGEGERFSFMVRPQNAVPGKSAVLNDALDRTSGEVIVVFDADGRVKPDFLKRTLPYLTDHGVGAAQARKVIMNAGSNILARCQYYEYLLDAHFQTGRDVIRGAVELRGNGQLVKRSALQSVGGWTEDTITDDLDLSTKLHLAGWDIRFINDPTVEEEGILHFKPLLRQRRRWAEGSLKRYLEYGVDMFTSPHVSRRATVDMLAYFLSFLFPLWVAADCMVQVLNLAIGEWPNHLVNSLIMLPILGIFFVSGLYTSINGYEKSGFRLSMLRSLETTVFMLLVWVPVVMWITNKILVTKDIGPLNWGKTEHLGTQAAILKESRFAQLKEMIQGHRH